MAYTPPSLGSIICQSRKEHGLTQRVLAERIDLTTRQLMALENDQSYPTFETLFALVIELEIPPQQIFGTMTADTELERFFQQLINCDNDDRKIIIETVHALMRSLREAKGN